MRSGSEKFVEEATAMFDESLLDSSPSRQSVLRGKHWAISIGVAALVFIAGYFALPMVAFGAETKVIIAQSAILAVLVGAFALMLTYVWADARHLGFSPGVWLVVVLLLNVVWFIIYLI